MTLIYFLIVSDPIGNPKSRSLTEPALLILFAIASHIITDWTGCCGAQGERARI